jgi:hypothetical protein
MYPRFCSPSLGAEDIGRERPPCKCYLAEDINIGVKTFIASENQ